MLLITHNNADPYFNLASEEYFLRNYGEEIIYLWRNDNAVIVGKHQNTIEEVNQQYVEATLLFKNFFKIRYFTPEKTALFIGDVEQKPQRPREKQFFQGYSWFCKCKSHKHLVYFRFS